ncbi:acetyltransferase [Dictyobacter sp. S3.2.2.5]|uniref:Acetyltransferase n=1 Tax=Dictyobacter halimunensis TaxID=3026934 RepID=A0ABQ6FPG3_9CHLR|nr:acetyltransferase [Dictyobacter sp. S3.2.2.5]
MQKTIEFDQLTIRSATRADVPTIVHLLADDVLGRQRECDQDPLPQAYYTAFEQIDRDPNNELIVVELAGEVIGVLQFTLIPSLSFQGGTRAQIESVRVDQRYRSHGIGRYLFEWAIERARQSDCRMVQLTTNASRGDAHRFYERLGFVSSHVGMKLDLARTLSTHQAG